MKAEFSNPYRNQGIITITAKVAYSDIEKMNRVVASLVEIGYEEIYGDGDTVVTVGTRSWTTIAEMKEDYSQAKKAAR